ncbi:MAG: hypothetical protein AAFX40_09700 [Cyanobacteria bacterium J06639_1]
MFWTALLLFGVAIAFWRLTPPPLDTFCRVLFSLLGGICLAAALAIAPMLLPTLGVLTLLAIAPICPFSSVLRQQRACSPWCAWRSQCRASRPQLDVSVTTAVPNRRGLKGRYLAGGDRFHA